MLQSSFCSIGLPAFQLCVLQSRLLTNPAETGCSPTSVTPFHLSDPCFRRVIQRVVWRPLCGFKACRDVMRIVLKMVCNCFEVHTASRSSNGNHRKPFIWLTEASTEGALECLFPTVNESWLAPWLLRFVTPSYLGCVEIAGMAKKTKKV